MATTSEILNKLNLQPNPEGGFYSETFRDTSVVLSSSQLPSECKFSPDALLFSFFSFSSV